MRWTVALVAVALSLVGQSQVTLGEETGPATVPPKRQCIIFCQWVNENDQCFMGGIYSLCDGEKVCLHPFSPSIDITLTETRSDGATVDVTIAQAETASPDGRALGVNAAARPHRDAHKKHVVEFVKFNDTLVIPMGEKRADGTAPRVEILVGAGDIIRWNWNRHLSRKGLSDEAAERQAIFDAIMELGFAKVSCERVSRLKLLAGERSYSELRGYVGGYAELAYLYTTLCPHRLGLVDVLAALSYFNDSTRIDQCEEALFGSAGHYHVILFDSPSLTQQVELINRLPGRSNVSVTVYTKNIGDRLKQEAGKLCVSRVCLAMTEPRFYWIECESHVNSQATCYKDRVKMIEVAWHVAEAAIPSLRELPNLEEVLIIANEKDEVEAKRSLEAVQKALPKAESHLVFFRSEKQPGKTPRKDDCTQQSKNEKQPAAANKEYVGSVNMGMVTARIIISEEEEQALGIPSEE